ncbi:MAG: nucleotide exchange factor GrpE [Rhodospirillales bacterium]|nr:nucleotide exchange factor GrpE [Rhodospirillales bacterium]MDE0379768.1 nucleotide exchange factor GrpE [Rhodospirillales bacterium]
MSQAARRGWGRKKGTKETMQDETERAEAEAAPAAEQSDADAAKQAGAADDAGEEGAGATPAEDGGGEVADVPDERDDADEDEGGDEALKDQLLRALADAENARRRAKKDVEDARAYAISRFAQDLLGVGDNLGRALDSIPAERRESDEAVKAIADGIEMTAREFETVLGRHGITRIDPLGETFDYNLHQALFETDQTDQPDGTVVQVLQTGYRIGDRLLREAMVGVAKGGAAAAAGDDAEAESEAETGADGVDTPADEPA